MKKRFNLTGVCFSEQHYMADTSAKFDRLGLDEGFLLIFDPRVNKDWKNEETMHKGKRIFSVWV